MAKDVVDGNWGQPKYSASGAPELGVDETQLSDYYSPMVPRRFTLLSTLLAASPPSAGYSAKADNCLGAIWIHNGSAWVMYGTAVFASAAARDAVITAPAAGMRCVVGTEDQVYTGSYWIRAHALYGGLIVPTVTATGGTATWDTGKTELTLGSGLTALAFDGLFNQGANTVEIELEWIGSVAAVACILQLAAAGAVDASAVYDRTGNSVDTASAVSRVVAGTSFPLSSSGNRGLNRHDVVRIRSANLARRTMGNLTIAEADATSDVGIATYMYRHRTASAFDGCKITWSGGSVSSGYANVRAI